MILVYPNVIEQLKLQISKYKFQTNSNYQNSKFQTGLTWSPLDIDIWCLIVIWYFGFGIFIRDHQGRTSRPRRVSEDTIFRTRTIQTETPDQTRAGR
jgi:hypothetical protein